MCSQLEDMLMRTSALLELKFHAACQAWLETRRSYISLKTAHEYELNINTLSKSFGIFYLTEIDADMIRKYQRQRQLEACGPSGINHETSVLQQILKRINRWEDIAPDFHPLKLPKWQPGRIITDTEKERLFRIAGENPNWHAAVLFAIISVNTTAGPKEVATLRLQDVDLEQRIIFIQPEGAKNTARIRPITLNDDAYEAMFCAVARARELGSTQPHHYVFPYRFNGSKKYDPCRHQTSFKTAWKKMCKAARLEGLHMYDLRRTAITDLLADPKTSDETVIKIAGHINRNMLKHYSYRRLDVIRDALNRLGSNKKRPAKVSTEENSEKKTS